ncbi:MAG: tonB-system energizer ExbB [Hyphomicrobiales bacterium]
MFSTVLYRCRPFVLALGLTMAGAAFAQSPVQPPAVTAPAQPSAPSATSAPVVVPSPAATSVGTPVIASAALPHDLSLWGMFLNADIVVKVVMVGLVFASLVTWSVWLAKNLELWKAIRQGRGALTVLNEARSLSEANAQLGTSDESVARLLRTAVHEVQISPHPDHEALKERIAWLLGRVEASASRRIGRGMGLLATIGATAPFVGLFGTVWGIMNSFIGISNAHTTNLAVVAPGIAEALLATALGLVAAIPAVVIYNMFSRQIGGYRALLADGSALVMRLLSRDCERVSSGMSPTHMTRAAE